MTGTTQTIFSLIDSDDLPGLCQLLDHDPGLVHVRHADPALYHWGTLQFAAARGKLEACRILVERGAEVYTNAANTYPPIMQAHWCGHAAIVDYFLKEIPEEADGTNRLGVTLVLAAREGWLGLVKQHLEADPLSVHQRGWVGETGLHWAAHNGHVEVATVLLDAGADIEADEINAYGGKPLHWASEHEPATVRLLLDRGAQVNSRNLYLEGGGGGFTPLIMNATQDEDCSEVTEMLLSAGADPALADEKGMTALDHARANGLKRITVVLEAATS